MSKSRKAKFKERVAATQVSHIDPSGCWIMVTSRPTCQNSPPKFSIHWSVPWPNVDFAKSQEMRAKSEWLDMHVDEPPEAIIKPTDHSVFTQLGREPNWLGARKVHFQGADVRLFPNEFSLMNDGKMRLYVLGDGEEEGSHVFMSGDAAGAELLDAALNGEQKPIYDAALVDGATHEQALIVALGGDISDEEMSFPPIGWYRVKPKYGLIFACEDELKIDGEAVLA